MARVSPGVGLRWQPRADLLVLIVSVAIRALKEVLTRDHRCFIGAIYLGIVALVPRSGGQAIIRGWGLVWDLLS